MSNTPKRSDNYLIQPRFLDARHRAGTPLKAFHITLIILRIVPAHLKVWLSSLPLCCGEPYKLSYQCHLIIGDSGCDVTCSPVSWIIHVDLSVFRCRNLGVLNIQVTCQKRGGVKLMKGIAWQHLEFCSRILPQMALTFFTLVYDQVMCVRLDFFNRKQWRVLV